MLSWTDKRKNVSNYRRKMLVKPVAGHSDPLHFITFTVGPLQFAGNLLFAQVLNHLHGVVVNLTALHVHEMGRFAVLH